MIRVVAAAILDANHRVLCAQRGVEERFPYKWEFPGGKIEPGESPEEALKRELKEELSVETVIRKKIVSTSFAYDDFQLNLTLFDAAISSGSITPQVHHDVKWLSFNEAEQLEWLPADVPLIEAVKRHYNPYLE